MRCLRMEQALHLAIAQADLVHERAIPFRRCTQALAENMIAIGSDQQARLSVFIQVGGWRARVLVAILVRTFADDLRGLGKVVWRDLPFLDLARLPPVLAEDGQFAIAPFGAAIAHGQLRQGDRRLLERRGLHQHCIADGNFA